MNRYHYYRNLQARRSGEEEDDPRLSRPVMAEGKPPMPPQMGARCQSLAMVYAPYQHFRSLYTPDKALCRGTLFMELDLPFEGKGGSRR